MKTDCAIWIVGFLIAALTNECHANLNGCDDFNDNCKDPARWGVDFTKGVAHLTETNGRLEYTTGAAPTEFDLTTWPWVLNYGSYTQSWEVHLDVNLPQLALSVPQFVAFGLLVVPGTNPAMAFTNRFSLDFHQYGDNAHEFGCNVAINTNESKLAEKTIPSTNVSLLIAFDANSKALSAYYDEDGSTCGHSWTFLASTNLDARWNLTITSVFGVQLFGNSQLASVVSTDDVYGDNFCASSGATSRLGITLGNGKVVLSWPTNAPACHLESVSALIPPICWQVVTNAPGIVTTNFTVTNVVSSATAFYRLSR